MPRLNLTPGVPTILAIQRAGENVPSNFTRGGFDVLFKTTDGDQLYVEPERAGDIEREMQALGIRYGEPMQLTKHKTTHGGHAYRVERLPNRDAGGHNVPERSAGYSAPQTPPAPRYAEPAAAAVTPTSARLLAAYMLAVDTLLETQVYASRKGLQLTVTTEDVRCLAATVLIEQSKGGAR